MNIGSTWIDFVRRKGTNVLEWAIRQEGGFHMYRFIGTTQRLGTNRFHYETADGMRRDTVTDRDDAVTIMYQYASLSSANKRQVIEEVTLSKEGLVRRKVRPPNFREMR